MAWEKSTPKSTFPALTVDIRSPVDGPGEKWTVPSKCSLYAAYGSEPWISPQDMERLKHLSEGLDVTRSPPLCDQSLKTLPKGCKLGEMVGEGAANAVFEFQLPDGGYLYHQNTRTFPWSSLYPTSLPARRHVSASR